MAQKRKCQQIPHPDVLTAINTVLPTDVACVVYSYAPLCPYTRRRKGKTVVGCDAVLCNSHESCTCCTINIFCEQAFDACEADSSCLLCMRVCRKCQKLHCMESCLRTCKECGYVICGFCLHVYTDCPKCKQVTKWKRNVYVPPKIRPREAFLE